MVFPTNIKQNFPTICLSEMAREHSLEGNLGKIMCCRALGNRCIFRMGKSMKSFTDFFFQFQLTRGFLRESSASWSMVVSFQLHHGFMVQRRLLYERGWLWKWLRFISMSFGLFSSSFLFSWMFNVYWDLMTWWSNTRNYTDFNGNWFSSMIYEHQCRIRWKLIEKYLKWFLKISLNVFLTKNIFVFFFGFIRKHSLQLNSSVMIIRLLKISEFLINIE